jgi:hypothetical protein
MTLILAFAGVILSSFGLGFWIGHWLGTHSQTISKEFCPDGKWIKVFRSGSKITCIECEFISPDHACFKLKTPCPYFRWARSKPKRKPMTNKAKPM